MEFLVEVGSSADYASELLDVLDEDDILEQVEMDEDGLTMALLLREPVDGQHRHIQLVVRTPFLAGPLLVEGTVWPTGMSAVTAIGKLKALEYVNDETADAGDEATPAAQSEEEHIGSTATAAVRPPNTRRPSVVRPKQPTRKPGGFWAWLGRHF